MMVIIAECVVSNHHGRKGFLIFLLIPGQPSPAALFLLAIWLNYDKMFVK